MPEKYQAPSVKKAFQILKLLSQAERGLGVSALAQGLGISKSTVHGITSALEDVGAVMRNPLNKRYNLGYTVIELGKQGLSTPPLNTVARVHLDRLMEETGETVFLGVRRDDHIIVLDVIESKKGVKITAPSGTKIPLTPGAVGKVVLAHMDQKSVLKYLASRELVKYTDNTITEVEQYLQELKEIRKKGVATDCEEYFQGVRAVAALVKTNSPVLVVLWVLGFSSSLADDRMEYLTERALYAANAISKDLKR